MSSVAYVPPGIVNRVVIDIERFNLSDKDHVFTSIELPGGWSKPYAYIKGYLLSTDEIFSLRFDTGKMSFMSRLSSDEAEKTMTGLIMNILREEYAGHWRDHVMPAVPED